MMRLFKYQGPEVDWLTRSTDRLHVMGTATTIEAQIPDLDAPKPIVDVLNRCVLELYMILQQAYYLEEQFATTKRSLREEKKLNAQLTNENSNLQTKCADQAKEIRNLKKSIEQLMR